MFEDNASDYHYVDAHSSSGSWSQKKVGQVIERDVTTPIIHGDGLRTCTEKTSCDTTNTKAL